MRLWLGILSAGLMALSANAQAVPAVQNKIIVKSLGTPCPDCAEGLQVPLKTGGRFYTYMRQWPGAYWEADITGVSFKLTLSDTANIFGVYVDGQKVDTQVKPLYQVFQYSGLPAGQHHLRIETQTESQASEYHGVVEVTVPDKGNVLPAPTPRPRQIEFIGDSYTVGYGNTSTKRQCTQDEIWATTDTQQAFGPLTAKHFNADYQINAYSGRGIVRNYDGFIGDPLPALYPYALFDGKSEYNDPTWQPQIVMIALGGNDFSTPVHAGEKWHSLEDLRADYIASYVAFVKTLRVRHPNASFILADYGEPEIISDIAEVIKRLNADGETRVAPFSAGSGFELTGCDYHLNTADDKRISATLIAYIDAHPELWQGK